MDATLMEHPRQERLDRHVRRFAAARRRRALPPPQVLLTTPEGAFAAGERHRPFHAASVGKLFTATLAYQLAQDGRLDLDAPITDVLGDQASGLFHDPHRVTAHHLLSHTSGAADYAADITSRRSVFLRRLLADPNHVWTPVELLDLTRARGDRLAPAGARYRYSDTGYVVLGLLLEAVGQAPLHDQLRRRIFEPLGMHATWMPFRSGHDGAAPDPDPVQSHHLPPLIVGGHDLARGAMLSADWAGGGHVGTLDDLTRFARAWHTGELLDATARRRMTGVIGRFHAGIHSGAGAMVLRYREFWPLLRLPDAVGHLGVSSVHLFSLPDEDIHLAMNLHSAREMTRGFRLHITLMHEATRASRGDGALP